ncbi:MAG: biotin--[acetyl-CoA-carboxylase] ligase [Chloroflexi bacterium RBG_16_72_14]|nr:MAG: biotin--[acetyl-CoA-carboxylase] ligase [Chloroflexi bacterium RBG_16_72_14]
MHPVAPPPPFLARVERFERVGSTNDVVRDWLDQGTPEVCVAVAGEQTAGRGRHGRAWQAPLGAALLASIGFRPGWLAPDRAWRLSAIVALAMCDAAEDAAGLPVGSIRLKWPNDLVVETAGPRALLTGVRDADEAAARLGAPLSLRKLAGVLGESDGLGTANPRVVVGIGINADWVADDFPNGLAGSMTSLREAAGGRPIDPAALLDGFLDRLEARTAALRTGYFDHAGWVERQATTGRLVSLEALDPAAAGPSAPVRALGVDAGTGALVVEDAAAPSRERLVHAGEVVHVRLAAEGV